jgi:hypothetical protein
MLKYFVIYYKFINNIFSIKLHKKIKIIVWDLNEKLK